MIGLDKSQLPVLYKSISLYLCIKRKTCKVFHISLPLSSYFVGHFVAHENLTLFSQPLEEVLVAYQPPKKPDLGHLDHFFP